MYLRGKLGVGGSKGAGREDENRRERDGPGREGCLGRAMKMVS